MFEGGAERRKGGDRRWLKDRRLWSDRRIENLPYHGPDRRLGHRRGGTGRRLETRRAA